MLWPLLPARDPGPDRRPVIGEVDRITAVVGARGVGKSTFLIDDALQFQRETNALVIGHSPGARLPIKLPDGRRAPIRWRDSLVDLRRGVRRDPAGFNILVSRNPGDPEAVVEFGRQLARAYRKAAIERAGFRFRDNRPPPPGVRATPVLILIDEGTSIRRKPTADELEEWEIFLTGARHENVALTWSIQAPTRRNWVLIEQSNWLVAFRYKHQWGLNAVWAAGVPREDLASIQELPKYEKLIYGPPDD